MKRLLPALAAAVLIHAVLLSASSRWLIRHDTTSPRTQVTTMRLIARAPVARPSIHPLPAPPPSLPPIPEKQALKTKPVVKKTRVATKPAPIKKVAVLPPPKPPPPNKPPQPAPEPSPPSGAKAEPTPLHKPLTTRATTDPTPSRTPEPASGEKSGTAATVVKATPRYHHNPPPEYPSLARKRGYQGTVVLEVFVETDGRVGNLRIIESSRHKSLDRSAMKAVRRWQFQPGRRGDRTIAMWVRVPVQFSLK
jgi:protein TonB